jgi:CRISPR/Cas system-associated exonuclease Cas4 (RecB family)
MSEIDGPCNEDRQVFLEVRIEILNNILLGSMFHSVYKRFLILHKLFNAFMA